MARSNKRLLKGLSSSRNLSKFVNFLEIVAPLNMNFVRFSKYSDGITLNIDSEIQFLSSSLNPFSCYALRIKGSFLFLTGKGILLYGEEIL